MSWNHLKGKDPWNKGKRETRIEVLERMSKSKLGSTSSIKTRKKISLALIGLKRSPLTCSRMSLSKMGEKNPSKREDVKRKMMIAKIGISRPVSVRKKISISLSGDKTHLWKGGIYPKNLLLRKSLKYKIWRERVFKRDNWTCVLCKRRGNVLNADHIKRFSEFPRLRFALKNGRTLCRECHIKTDNYGSKKSK